jgi:hypothetical protein
MEVLVLHGWTDSASNLRNKLKSSLPSKYSYTFINAPFNNQWFEYSYSKNNTLLGKYDLEYKTRRQLDFSLEYVHDYFRKVIGKGNDVFIIGTSQGATIALMSLLTFSHPNLRGGWIHNPAGIYNTNSDINENYKIRYEYCNTTNHSLDFQNEETLTSFTSFMRDNGRVRRHKIPEIRLFFSKNDEVIAPEVTDDIISKLVEVNLL